MPTEGPARSPAGPRRCSGARSQTPQWSCRLCSWPAGRHLAVAPVAELLDESRTRRTPLELGARPRRVGALVEQQDLGESVADPRPRLVVGTGDRPRGADGDRRRLGELGNGRVPPITDDV